MPEKRQEEFNRGYATRFVVDQRKEIMEICVLCPGNNFALATLFSNLIHLSFLLLCLERVLNNCSSHTLF